MCKLLSNIITYPFVLCKYGEFFAADNLPYEKVGEEVTCLSDLAPFEIPETWEWCRVGDLFSNISGLSYKKDLLSKKSEHMVRVLRGGNIGDELYQFKNDDIFIADEYVKSELYLKKNYMITPAVSSLEHIGKIALIEQDYNDVVVGGFVLMLIPNFSDDIISKYLLYAFAAKNHRDNCRNITHKSGQAFYNLSREKLMNLPIPLPPKSEMKRIIKQLSIVLPLADEYSNIEFSLNYLNNSFPELLKKAILQEAVQGRLVPQNPNDEPASVLLERIRAEKEQLIKEGKIKKDKHESVIFRRDNSHYEKCGFEEVCIDEKLPFDIPNSWTWCRFSDICYKLTDGSHNPPPKKKEGYRVISARNIQNGNIIFTDEDRFCDKQGFDKENPRTTISRGDVILGIIGGSIGKTAIYNSDEPVIAQRSIAIFGSLICNAFMRVVLDSPLFQQQFAQKTTGTAQGGIYLGELSNMFFPLPPKEEQMRILSILKTLEEQILSM